MVNPTYLLDSDILSEPAKPVPDASVAERIRRECARIVIPAPVWHEVLFGCQRLPESARRREIEKYLSGPVVGHFRILPYDESAAAWHASERARLTNLGKPPAYADGQIAAVAAVNGLVLVTGNERDYKDFEGLKIENWRRG